MKRLTTTQAGALLLAAAATSCAGGEGAKTTQQPNVVIIYADDMGYGDMSCQNPESKIQTPNLDRLASQGMRFTDGHSSSGVSSPSRFGLLSGTYHWRRAHNIVNAYESNHFFVDGELTMPQMFKNAGYFTAAVGKWHLGWDWESVLTEEGRQRDSKEYQIEDFDFSKRFTGGPIERGFDYYFGDGTINFPPYAWIENDRVITPPTKMLRKGEFVALEGGGELREGPMYEEWSPETILPTLADKMVSMIEQQSGEEPFFFYFPLTAPHAPIVPIEEYHGKSQAGYYGDFVVQCDDIVGRVMQTLEDKGLDKNTIVVFSADNGPEHYAYARQDNFDHNSTQSLRGVKRDTWEGGHRVPFIVKWDGVVEKGAVCDEVVNQVDLMATFADIIGYDLPNDAAVDSYDLLPLLEGKRYDQPLREATVQNTYAGCYALRQGDWKLINSNTGTTTKKSSKLSESRFTEYTHEQRTALLFNIREDQDERHDLSQQYPERVAQMQALLERYQTQGRSIPLRHTSKP